MVKIKFVDVARGVPFVVYEDWNNVYLRTDNKVGMVCIGNKGDLSEAGYITTKHLNLNEYVWLIDPADIPFNTQPEPEPKFKVGDLVRVVGDSFSNGLKGQIAEVNSVSERPMEGTGWGKYEGQYKYAVTGSNYQSVAESSLKEFKPCQK